jgi:hypothetical protein
MTPVHRWRSLSPFLAAFLAILFTVIGSVLITPQIAQQRYIYRVDPDVIYPPARFYDAQHYAFICLEGYWTPTRTLPEVEVARTSWMPVYGWLQCGLRGLTGVSLVYAGMVVTALANGVSVFVLVLLLRRLRVRRAGVHAMVAALPALAPVWFWLPGIEGTFLAIGMIALYAVWPDDQPIPPRFELLRLFACFPIGLVFILTKPNALAMILPLSYLFLYASWGRSRAVGYKYGLFAYSADVVIAHLPLLSKNWRAQPDRPLAYDWRAPLLIAGIIVGFAGYVAYASWKAGIPFHYLQQQLEVWVRGWSVGNVSEMIAWHAQALRPPDIGKPWRYGTAWHAAATVLALVPAASRRVPMTIRVMLGLMGCYVLFTGTAHYSNDRYMISTALVALGWACWIGGGEQTRARNVVIRWGFVIVIAGITSVLLLEMFSMGQPVAYPITELDYPGVVWWDANVR